MLGNWVTCKKSPVVIIPPGALSIHYIKHSKICALHNMFRILNWGLGPAPEFSREMLLCLCHSLTPVSYTAQTWLLTVENFVTWHVVFACSDVLLYLEPFGRVQLKRDGTRWRTGGEVKEKLMNGVGSQSPSHYNGTRCIQHYYRWCAHLGCQ